MHRRLGVFLSEPNNIKQTLTAIHRSKLIHIISVEAKKNQLAITMEWAEFNPVNTRKQKIPTYNNNFFMCLY